MDYSKFVSLVNEQNRPSGGIKSIFEACRVSAISSNDTVLEIGCNTGFTTGNIASIFGCKTVGVDTNSVSLSHAQNYMKLLKVTKDVSLVNGNAEKLEFDDAKFDLVWLSNVPSFSNNKVKMVSEAVRVLKPGGRLIVIPIYYKSDPPADLVEKIGNAIGSKIDIRTLEEWLRIYQLGFESTGAYLPLIYRNDYEYDDIEECIPAYLNSLFAKQDNQFNVQMDNNLRTSGDRFYRLFNENLKYCSYSILVFFKQHCFDQPELFKTIQTSK